MERLLNSRVSYLLHILISTQVVNIKCEVSTESFFRNQFSAEIKLRAFSTSQRFNLKCKLKHLQIKLKLSEL